MSDSLLLDLSPTSGDKDYRVGGQNKQNKTIISTFLVVPTKLIRNMLTFSVSYKEKIGLAATLWWFTAAPKPLKIQVFWGITRPPGIVQPLYSRGHN